MNCKEFDDKISLYIDGKLNSDDEKAFLDHSNDCQRCHRAMENTKRMLDSLEELNHIKAPKDLSNSIIQALEMEMVNLGNVDPQESLKESLEEHVQKNGQITVRKNEQLETDRSSQKSWFLKQSPWIRKVALAAVLVLIVTSAVILSNDWLPSSMESDMVAMEGAEESAQEERVADEFEDVSDSMENEESPYVEEEPGFTGMEDEDTTFDEATGSEEDLDREALDEDAEVADGEAEALEETETLGPDDAADGEGGAIEESGENTFGLKYGIWIVLLLEFGVISVIVVLRKNRKNLD